MELNGPGTSLFQEGDLHAYDNNAQREEEEEALEDQRRRDIELKNILENEFNDVSFDNDEYSGMNLSFSNASSNHNNSSSGKSHKDVIGDINSSLNDFIKHDANEINTEFHTPVRQLRGVRSKVINFSEQHEADKCSDLYRNTLHNGSLHDIVDASGGGGGDAGVSLHYNHCHKSNSFGEYNTIRNAKCVNASVNEALNKQYRMSDYNTNEQLQILYEVRVREVHRLTELIDKTKNNHEIEKSDLKRQLALGKAEIERLKLNESELQKIIVINKQEIEDRTAEVHALKTTINNLEESKEKLLVELDTCKISINDLERKVLALEKGRKDKTAALQYESNISELKEKHALSMKSISEDLEKHKISLEKTNRENEELKRKIIETSRVNDENIAKKSEIIQRLSKQLEESQEQYEKLMKNSLAEDNIKLQMEMKLLKEENFVLNSKIEILEKNLANQESELKQYECLSNFSAFESKGWGGDNPSEKENDCSDMNRKLREELFRALSCQKSRRQEIQSLQALILKKEEQIHNMAEKERLFVAEAAKFREDIGEYVAELKKFEGLTAIKESENRKLTDVLQNTRKELESELEEARKMCAVVESENKSLRQELEGLKNSLEKEKSSTVTEYNEEYLKFHNEGLRRAREEVQELFKLEILGKDIEIENLKKEMEEVKTLYVEVYNEKESLLNQVEKEKASSIGRSNGVGVEDVRKLQRELEKSRQRILELDLTLRQQYQQEVENLNATIKLLNLEIEKLKKENEHDAGERNKLTTENELLKSEVEQITAEKNLHFLNCEKLKKELDGLREEIESVRESVDVQKGKSEEEHNRDIRGMYEIKIQKLNKEIELMLMKSTATDSKCTSPPKASAKILKHIASQRSPVQVQSASTSPLRRFSTRESATSPVCDSRPVVSPKNSIKDASMLTDPEPKKLPKREVVRMMEKLGAKHEEEMCSLENNYRLQLIKLEKKWQAEIDCAKEKVRLEMMNVHVEELRELQEKHRTEMENRVEQEKKEAVVALITEWACEVQSLKQSQAEAVAQAEKMKMKYKTAKNTALRYKAYFTSKAQQMKEEWRKVEEGYENALKELEKNVHMLVDVREDEVEAKVKSMTEAYEHKIRKMRSKLEKYEYLLKNEVMRKDGGVSDEKKSKSSSSERGPDNLVMPNSHLCRKIQ